MSGSGNSNGSGNPGSSSSGGNQGSIGGNAAAPVSVVTDPGYKLNNGDQINVSVYGEGDLTCAQLIDRDGIARLPQIEDMKLTGYTVREAEHVIEEAYKKQKILKKPVVTLVVTGFAPREVMVFGAVGAPGAVGFPRDATQLDIVEVIIRAGGFKPAAKSKSVIVRHKEGKEGDVHEVSSTVDVEAMMFSKKRGEQTRASFPIYPGDIINVDVSIF